MSATPVEAPTNGDSDTFLIARSLMQLASTPWYPPTPESLEVAVASYQAALKLQSIPRSETDTGSGAASLKRRLDLVTKEVRALRQVLRDTREETGLAFFAMNARLQRLADSTSHDSDTTTESSEEGIPGHQDTIAESPSSSRTTVVDEDIAVTVSIPENPGALGINNATEGPIQTSPNDATSQSRGHEGATATASVQASNTRWTPRSVGRSKQALDESSLEFVEKKAKGLLNKLTMENFGSVSDQIVDLANRSENERNCETLVLVLKLVFEKATDESQWAEMYARLCRKMMEQISPNVQDETLRDATGKPVVGGILFRKLLLNRCQESFERGWLQTETPGGGHGVGEPEMLSDEYYLLAKAKRQGLGLVRLIGELFKMQMLTERIIHECIKRLLPDIDDPNEADIESLCNLLSTVGKELDVLERKFSMDLYLERMETVAESGNVTARIRCLILDLIELRKRYWKPRSAEPQLPPARQGSEQPWRSNLISVLGRRLSQPERGRY